MIIRNQFITNSSSTSFICYGIGFRISDVVEIKDQFSFRETKEWASELKRLYKEISVSMDSYLGTGVILIRDSYCDLEDWGYTDLPLDKIMERRDKTEQWDQLLNWVCVDAGLAEHVGNPGWITAVRIGEE